MFVPDLSDRSHIFPRVCFDEFRIRGMSTENNSNKDIADAVGVKQWRCRGRALAELQTVLSLKDGNSFNTGSLSHRSCFETLH